MTLYCRLPFGKFHSRNPDVIRLAEVVGRTPSSVAMKLSNLASLDPAHQLRGVKGLSGASKSDRAIWDEFHADWGRLAVESELVWKRVSAAVDGDDDQGEGLKTALLKPPPAGLADVSAEAVYLGETEVARPVKVRLAQRFFRRAVLASYQARCCVSDIHVPVLLVASHIVPWKASPAHRADPRNGICLSRLHDGAFDRGLMTFDEEFRLVISGELKLALTNRVLAESFQPYEGQVMQLPDKFRPLPEFLARHRNEVFCG